MTAHMFLAPGEAAEEGYRAAMRCCLVEIVDVVAEGITAEPFEDARVTTAARLVDRGETAEPLGQVRLVGLLVRIIGIAEVRGRSTRIGARRPKATEVGRRL